MTGLELICDGCFAVGQCCHDLVSWSETWIRDMLVLELDCVGESLTSCSLDMTVVDSIVFWGGVEIPAVD